MPPKALFDAKLVAIFQDHASKLERQAWTNMNPEEFSESFLGLMKDLANATYKLRKSDCLRALRVSKLSLTPAELDLLAEKIKNTVRYARKRLRDCGSGKRLPMPVQALLKIWAKKPKKERVKALDKEGRQEALDKEGREEALAKEGREEALAKESPKLQQGPSESEGGSMEKKNIRDVFGLPKKQTPAEIIDLEETCVATSSAASSSTATLKQPSQSAGSHLKKRNDSNQQGMSKGPKNSW